MAAGLPEITMAGTLVADPELRFTPGGAAVASFTVACNERRMDRQSGEWVDGDATFVRCQIWRAPAENLVETATRGMRVVVTGSLKQRSFETREGEKRTVFEVDASEVAMSLKFAVGKMAKAARSGGAPIGGRGSAPANDDPWGSAPPASGSKPLVDDEPPF